MIRPQISPVVPKQVSSWLVGRYSQANMAIKDDLLTTNLDALQNEGDEETAIPGR